MANIKLTWPGSSSGTYEVEYKKSADNFWISPAGSPVTGTTLIINGLLDSTAYTFRVRSLCESSVSPWVYQSFNTGTGSCPPPTAVSISNASETSLNVSWTASVNAIGGYVVQYKTSDSSTWLSLPNTTGTSTVISGLTAGTQYQVRVVGLCAGANSGTSAVATGSTLQHFTQCQNIQTSAPTIVKNDSTTSYTATYTNTGGTPSTHVVEFSINGGSTWIAPASIINQTSTSVTYTIPSGSGTYPVTHMLRVTPKCPDNSTGTPGITTYTAPSTPTQFITFQNRLGAGSISVITIDGGGDIVTSDIPVNGDLNWNQTGLFTGTHSISINFSGVSNGTKVKIDQIRGTNVIYSSSITYNSSSFIFGTTLALQNGDVIKIYPYPATNNFLVTNAMPGASVFNVTPTGVYTINQGAYPIPYAGTNVLGTHNGFSTAISIGIIGTPSGPSKVAITKNSTLLQCIDVTSQGTYTFNAFTFLSTDVVQVSAVGTPCNLNFP